MADKRRDNKNRLLQKGESQRKRDGLYVYKYIGLDGKPKFVYSWRLTPTDRPPAGKKHDLSLREKIAQIRRDMEDGIKPEGRSMKVAALYSKYTACRPNVKQKTVEGRERFQRRLDDDPFGQTSIDRIALSDAKEWVIRLQQQGLAYGTIKGYVISLRAAFKLAIQDDLVRKNPFDFQLGEVIENDTQHRDAMTPMQQEALLNFVQNDPVYKKYYDVFVILLGTGLRISELCGLTDKDIDFEKKFISVDHQLKKTSETGYYIDSPKTRNGVRKIPMSSQVQEAMRRVADSRTPTKKPFVLDGYSGFLFLNTNGKPMENTNYAKIFKHIITKYNKHHDEPLPEGIAPHILRHTFCTEMAAKGMNPKTLQGIMGHSSIRMTMDYYAHMSLDNALAEIERIAG